jgi:hypothetical protein
MVAGASYLAMHKRCLQARPGPSELNCLSVSEVNLGDVAGRKKQVYKVIYPNGKIYVGLDLTGTLTYFGSPSPAAKERITGDLAEHRLDLTVRKQILWESETATDAEVRAMEVKLIREHRSNDPAVG